MDRNDRSTLILGILIILALVVGYYFLLLGPLRTEYGGRVQERSDKEARLAQLQQEVAQAEEVRRNAPTIERQLLELSKRVPAQPQIPSLVVQVEEVALAAGVTQVLIQPATPEPPPGGGDFSRIPVTMTFEGTYEQLQDFLLRTQNLVRLVTVNEVSYQPAEQEATEAQLQTETLLQVEIQAEVYAQPSEVPSGPAPLAPAAPETPPPGGETIQPEGGETVAQ